MNKRGIYKIINKINGKIYIGESLNIDKRWDKHKEDLNSNEHHSYKLQKDWNELGENNFEFEIITLLDKDIKKMSDEYILLIYEDHYIREYNTINNGYNIENTLEKVLNGEKKVFEGKNDKYAIEIYQKQIDDDKIVNKNGRIYNPQFYSIKDLKEKINTSRPKVVEYFLMNNVVCRSKIHKYKYELLDEYKDSEDIFLNNEAVGKIRFTEKGLQDMYDLYLLTE